jgi:hypothetical protein
METLENIERLRAVTGRIFRPGSFGITDRGLSFFNFQKARPLCDGSVWTNKRIDPWLSVGFYLLVARKI